MPVSLLLTPFPIAKPRQGGQVRAASVARGLTAAHWTVHPVGLYHGSFFRRSERGAADIVLDRPEVAARASDDVLFGDLHVAKAASRDPRSLAALRDALTRLRPDAIHLEHPWAWLALREVLPSGPRPKIVYDSHNIEWAAREALFPLGLNRPDAEAMLEQTRVLETELAREADLVFAISDLEAARIARAAGRPVVYLPPASDLALLAPGDGMGARGERYAALMGSAYWPNVEGFFDLFPEGLGFLARDEHLWIAGELGAAIRADTRFADFAGVNEARVRTPGFMEDRAKPDFFGGAVCALAPVRIGGGAKLKTVDAIASGRPAIVTTHALEGLGSVVEDVLNQGVYVADTPTDFRALIRRAFREGLTGCPPAARARLSLDRLSMTVDKWSRKALGENPCP